MNYAIPGWMISCFEMSSLLHSTLQCLYDESDCLRVVFLNIKRHALDSPGSIEVNFRLRPLIYNSESSRFSINTSVETLLQHLMVDKWNSQGSYRNYYDTCSPIYCTYSYITKNKSITQLLVACISMIGGLTAFVRFIAWNVTGLLNSLFDQPTHQRQSRRGKRISAAQHMFDPLFRFTPNCQVDSSTEVFRAIDLFEKRHIEYVSSTHF